MNKIFYREIMGAGWATHLKPLYPTGRWKLVTNPYYENELYIEHQGFLFKSWWPESQLRYARVKTETVFNCTGEKK